MEYQKGQNKVLSNKVLIVGNNHHNTLSMVRCFGEAGYDVELICKGSRLGCAAKSKYVKQTLIYREDVELIQLLKNNYDNLCEPLVVISCDDLSTHVLDTNYEEMKGRFVIFNAGYEGRVTECQDKNVQSIIAEEAGCLVPKSIVYIGRDKVQFNHYPCLIKPLVSFNGGKKIMICNSQDELDRNLKHFANGNPVIIQQFVFKDFEVVMLGLSYHGDVFIPGYIRKIRDNRGGTTYSEVFPISEIKKELVEQSKAIIKEIGYEGLFGIEYIHNEQGFYFVEVNLRNDATCYALAKAGVNLPVTFFKAAMGGDVRELLADSEVKMIRSMVELKDFKFVLKGKVSPWQWLKELKEAECKYYYSKEDKKPFLYAILSIIMRVIPIH